MSYFRELKGLGPTLGSAGSIPVDVNEAVGRLMTREDKLSCFGCHATDAVSGRQITLEKLKPGVQCNHCHHDARNAPGGDGAKWLPAGGGNRKREVKRVICRANIGFLRTVSPDLGRTGCATESQAIANVRFQPYRLAGSKCYDADDARISCLACHDPHHELSAETTDYDPKCQACHGGGKPGAKVCPVSKSRCASCHMPKLELREHTISSPTTEFAS